MKRLPAGRLLGAETPLRDVGRQVRDRVKKTEERHLGHGQKKIFIGALFLSSNFS